jgi:hypothetical protein
MYASMMGFIRNYEETYHNYKNRIRACMDRNAMPRWSRAWAKRLFDGVLHLNRHPYLPAAKLLRLQCLQCTFNAHRRTLAALQLRDRTLGTRGMPGLPQRTSGCLQKLAAQEHALRREADKRHRERVDLNLLHHGSSDSFASGRPASALPAPACREERERPVACLPPLPSASGPVRIMEEN